MTERQPNPYTLGPIRKRERLAGRTSQLKELDYYLKLTQSGQSPHLALIGQRGVGKTSLLSAAGEIARTHKLLPVLIDLNETKVQSAGIFWHDVYSALILSAAEVGCWGGTTGKIYAALLSLIYQRKLVDLELAVLQFPLAVAAHDGNLETLLCPDALIVHDFGAIRAELRSRGLNGIALLFDEGDCVGSQRGLLQMLRNVLQRVEATCFVITGTESLFDVVSDVFSPIPRQFHRLDVARFSDWTETLELARKSLQGPEDVRPSSATVIELHEICQGDPSEIQLYCHHMYKLVEDGSAETMELRPDVYRAVRRAYRAHTQTVDERVLDAIDQLPEQFLFKSRWLQRRRVTLEENAKLERLRLELKKGALLTSKEQVELERNIAATYKELHQRGISSSPISLELVGGAVTAGYWKSLVQTQEARGWAWVDDPLIRLVQSTVVGFLENIIEQGIRRGEVEEGEMSATEALAALRDGKGLKNISRMDFSRWMHALVIARAIGKKSVVDVSYGIGTERVHNLVVSYVGEGTAVVESRVTAWIVSRNAALAGHGVSVSVDHVAEWTAPTDREVNRLARVAQVPTPGDMFGPSIIAEALDMFFSGDITGAIELFDVMIRDREGLDIRNNMAYCLIASGKTQEALLHIRKAKENPTPLRLHNWAVAEALNGDVDAAQRILQNAWHMQERSSDEEEVVCMLLLSRDRITATSVKDIPLIAAIWINMLILGCAGPEETTKRLAERYPENYLEWLQDGEELAGPPATGPSRP